MKVMTITRFRRELFSVMESVEQGETVQVTRNGAVVATILPMDRPDWRDSMPFSPALLVDEESAFAPLEEEWEQHL